MSKDKEFSREAQKLLEGRGNEILRKQSKAGRHKPIFQCNISCPMYSLSLPPFSSQPATPKCKTLLFKKQKKRKKLISPNSYIYAMLKAIHWTWPFSQFIERKWKEFRLCWAQKLWKGGGCLRFSVTKCNSNRWKPSAASASTDLCRRSPGRGRAQPGAGPAHRGDPADLGPCGGTGAPDPSCSGALPGGWEADNERCDRNQTPLPDILLFIDLNERESNFYETDLGTGNFTVF